MYGPVQLQRHSSCSALRLNSRALHILPSKRSHGPVRALRSADNALRSRYFAGSMIRNQCSKPPTVFLVLLRHHWGGPNPRSLFSALLSARMRSSSEISRAETTRQHSFRHVLTAHERYNKSFRYLHNVCTRHTIVLGWHQLHSSLKRSLSKKLNTSSNVSFKNSSVRHFEKRNSSWSHRDYRVPGRNKTAAREKQKNKKKLFCRYLYFYLSIYL